MFSELNRFLIKEIFQASNIQDKNNRSTVERSLYMIQTLMKTFKIQRNGVIICSGIDRNGNEIIETIVPLNPIDKFTYNCSKRFELEQFDKYFEVIPLGFILFLSGTECIFYKYNGLFEKIYQSDALLLKHHNKGGQSANRFQENSIHSRTHYITRIIDVVNEYCNNKSINYIFGGEDLKKQFLTSDKLKYNFKTESKYHTFNKHTINDPYFTEIVSKITINMDKIYSELVKHIEFADDVLLFSPEEINEHKYNIEYVLIIDLKYDMKEDNYPFKIYRMNQRVDPVLYTKLKDFKIIGKLYFQYQHYDE